MTAAELKVVDPFDLLLDEMENFDNSLALSEGWDLFECGGSMSGPIQIQADDEAGILNGDTAAWRLVWEKAQQGSAYHQHVLDLVANYNPEEMARVLWVAAAGNEVVPYGVDGECMIPTAEEILQGLVEAPTWFSNHS